MTQQQYVIRRKLNILELGEQLGNVSLACKNLGISRQHFYDIKNAIAEDGIEGLLEKTRKTPRALNRVPADVEEKLLSHCLEYPAWGQVRMSNELKKLNYTISPGEVFIHRNIANLVVSTDSNLNAVVQYAVERLKVKHIIICGHYECGGVNAALNPSDMGQLNSWLQTLRDVYRFQQKELDAIADNQKKFDRLVELNVREQCINIIKKVLNLKT